MVLKISGFTGMDGDLNHPPVSPRLLPKVTVRHSVCLKMRGVKGMEIKLSIEFPLKSGAQGGNILLFFK